VRKDDEGSLITRSFLFFIACPSAPSQHQQPETRAVNVESLQSMPIASDNQKQRERKEMNG